MAARHSPETAIIQSELGGIRGQITQLEKGVHARIGQLEKGVHARIDRLEGAVDTIRTQTAGQNRELGELGERVTVAQKTADDARAEGHKSRAPLSWTRIGALIGRLVVGLAYAAHALRGYLHGGIP